MFNQVKKLKKKVSVWFETRFCDVFALTVPEFVAVGIATNITDVLLHRGLPVAVDPMHAAHVDLRG